MKIEHTKSGIERIINEHFVIYTGSGRFEPASAIIRAGNSIDSINNLEQKINFKLPGDYKEFLLLCNGIQFTSSSELSIYGIDEILENMDYMNYVDGIIPIGYCMEEYIVMNCKEISSNQCIYAGDAYCPDEYYPLNCNFTEFFDRYITANLSNYWTWMKGDKKFIFIKI